MKLSLADKKLLLLLAHQTIQDHHRSKKSHLSSKLIPSKTLEINCGVFVSLYIKDKLRGCIGTFSEENSIFRNVENMALSSATSDSRFKPIKSNELADIKIEISVLTPKERIYDSEDIVLGKHGIYMEQGTNRGTFLPQVAISQNWSVEEFLGNCAKYKAGLEWDGWKTAQLYIYEAIVFNNKDAGLIVNIS